MVVMMGRRRLGPPSQLDELRDGGRHELAVHGAEGLRIVLVGGDGGA